MLLDIKSNWYLQIMKYHDSTFFLFFNSETSNLILYIGITIAITAVCTIFALLCYLRQRITHQGHTLFDVATTTTGYNICDGIGDNDIGDVNGRLFRGLTDDEQVKDPCWEASILYIY